MRELIESDEMKSRRATWMEPATLETGACVSAGVGCAEPPTLGEQAVRLARVATAIHLDQAAKLRVLMAQAAASSVPIRAFSTLMKGSP